MNKGIVIGIVSAIVIIGLIAAFSDMGEQSSDNLPTESIDMPLELEETEEPAGRNLTLEFSESMGVSSP